MTGGLSTLPRQRLAKTIVICRGGVCRRPSTEVAVSGNREAICRDETPVPIREAGAST